MKNATAVRALLEQSKKVLAVFQGHRHEGGYSHINGIHYYTLKAVIEGSGAENSAYAIVEADDRFNLTVTGYRRADSRKSCGEPGALSPEPFCAARAPRAALHLEPCTPESHC